MNTIKKTLCYYWYLDNDVYEFHDIYKFHVNCIKSWPKIFDEVIFILSVNDTTNTSFIEYWINKFNNAFDFHIKFIVVQNQIYCEGIHFYNIIFKDLQNIDGLVFWGHAKRDFEYDIDNIKTWIGLHHYINSTYHKDIEDKLLYDNCLFGGTLLTSDHSHRSFQIYYNGSFYWFFPKKIYKKYNYIINELIYMYDNYILNKPANEIDLKYDVYCNMYELSEIFPSICSGIDEKYYIQNKIYNNYAIQTNIHTYAYVKPLIYDSRFFDYIFNEEQLYKKEIVDEFKKYLEKNNCYE